MVRSTNVNSASAMAVQSMARCNCSALTLGFSRRCGQDGRSGEGVTERAEEILLLFAHRREITADPREDVRSGEGAKAAGDLGFDLDHPNVSLGLILGEGDVGIVQKG